MVTFLLNRIQYKRQSLKKNKGLVAQKISTKYTCHWQNVTRRARGRSLVDGSNLTESEFFPQIFSSIALIFTLFDQLTTSGLFPRLLTLLKRSEPLGPLHIPYPPFAKFIMKLIPGDLEAEAVLTVWWKHTNFASWTLLAIIKTCLKLFFFGWDKQNRSLRTLKFVEMNSV